MNFHQPSLELRRVLRKVDLLGGQGSDLLRELPMLFHE